METFFLTCVAKSFQKSEHFEVCLSLEDWNSKLSKKERLSLRMWTPTQTVASHRNSAKQYTSVYMMPPSPAHSAKRSITLVVKVWARAIMSVKCLVVYELNINYIKVNAANCFQTEGSDAGIRKSFSMTYCLHPGNRVHCQMVRLLCLFFLEHWIYLNIAPLRVSLWMDNLS